MRLTPLLAIAGVLALLGPAPSGGRPGYAGTLAQAVDKSDVVGIVRVAEVPPAPKGGFRASTPPTVVARPVSMLKGDAKADLRVVWQTLGVSCDLFRDLTTIEVDAPAVGDEYLVFLVKGKDGNLHRLNYAWHFLPVPASLSVRSSSEDWRGLIEVFPGVAAPGEAVRYRRTATRLATASWTGEHWNMIAADFDVIDFTRKQVLEVKKPGVRTRAPAVFARGDTYLHEVDLADGFGITRPGEYWVFRGSEGPYRVEVTDKIRKAGGGR
ncbi:MAG: hypothetical protein C0501_02965 [Isosphaera sp.]|nr:hypothetical protein [Isosphaera sp.]